jgi:DNA-directed RNA polymerase subunit RPC12/RpoP
MDDRFQVDLRQYSTVAVRCPSCSAKYLLKLRQDHSALAQRENGEILIYCPECARAKRLGRDNFEIKGKEVD